LRVDAGVLENLGIGPDDVRPVDVGGDRVDRTLHGQQVDELVREGIPEPELVIEVRDVLDLPGIDVVLQFHTRVGLERVRRVTGLQTGLQQVLGGRSCTTGHCTVDELDVGVLLVEDVDECFQGVLFGTGGPPGEYFDRIAAVIAAFVTTATTAPGKGEAGRGNSSDC